MWLRRPFGETAGHAMISIQNVSKSFLSKTLYEKASLQINFGDRFAIVGPNGSGKSTFFKIIAGECEPDGGSIQIKRGITYGYLAQEIDITTKTALETALSRVDDPDPRTEAEAKQIMAGLGFNNSTFTRPVNELSGGWAMRAELASLLLMKPDMLLLDEPTNHLDLSSVEWLKDWLQDFAGAIAVISHDRDFINHVCHSIVSLEQKTIKVYTGDYENYVEQSESERERLIARWKDQQEEIEHLNEFVRRNRARMSTAARAQSALKRLARMELIDPPATGPEVAINFPRPEKSGQRVIALKGVSKYYGTLTVYDKLDFELDRGQKLALAGKNGAGKSTLIKLLAGTIAPDEGERVEGINVTCGYYSQRRSEMLDPKKTVLAEAMHSGRSHTDLFIRTLLGAFLFRGDDVFKKTAVLSGGEKSRLALAKILLNPPNLLLLDEPTTHLDIPSVEALVRALQSYDGTLCFISHDVYFINSVANGVLHTSNGKLTMYPGNYDYFKSRVGEDTEGEPEQSAPAPSPIATPEPRATAPVPQRKITKGDAAKLMKSLEKLITEQEKLEAEMAQPQAYVDYQKAAELSAKLSDVTKTISETELKILESEAA